MPRFEFLPAYDVDGNTVKAGPEPEVVTRAYLNLVLDEIGIRKPGILGYGLPSDAKRTQEILIARGYSSKLISLLDQAA